MMGVFVGQCALGFRIFAFRSLHHTLTLILITRSFIRWDLTNGPPGHMDRLPTAQSDPVLAFDQWSQDGIAVEGAGV